jgi:hypothetical protein
MANGVALNPETAVGKVRLVVGDGVPDAAGDYTFSDDAIGAALALAGEGITRAVAILVKQLALQAALSGQSIKADDFSFVTTGRGKSLLDVAESYERQADTEDAIANAGEILVVSTKLKAHDPEHFLPSSMRGRLGSLL